MAKRLIRGGFSIIRLYVFKSGLSSLLVGVENCPGVRSTPLLCSKGRTPGRVAGGVGLGVSDDFRGDKGDPLWIRCTFNLSFDFTCKVIIKTKMY